MRATQRWPIYKYGVSESLAIVTRAIEDAAPVESKAIEHVDEVLVLVGSGITWDER